VSPRRSLRILALLAVVPGVLVGCAGADYRERSTLSYTCYATIENFSDNEITAHQVDGLLEEVAEILAVALDPAKPRVRIVVRPSNYIQAMSEGVAASGYGSKVQALYVDGADLVVIPYYSRTILGHELAHYLTDHYLKSTPRSRWERIARTVEHALPATAPRDARGGPNEHDGCWAVVRQPVPVIGVRDGPR
jgi:hypothetical protein